MSNRDISTFRSIGDVIAPIVARAAAVQRARAAEAMGHESQAALTRFSAAVTDITVGAMSAGATEVSQ